MMYLTTLSLVVTIGLAIANPVHVVEKASQVTHPVTHVPIKAVKYYLSKTKLGAKGLVTNFQDVIDSSQPGAGVDHHRNIAKGYLPKAIKEIEEMRKAADTMLRRIDENGLESPQLLEGKADCHQLKKTIDAIREISIEGLCSELKRQEIIAYFKSDLNCLLGSIFELWRATERDGAYLTLGYREVIKTIKDLLVTIENGIKRFSEEINYMDFSNDCHKRLHPEKASSPSVQVPVKSQIESKAHSDEGKDETAKDNSKDAGKDETAKDSPKDEGKGADTDSEIAIHPGVSRQSSLVEKVEKIINLEKKQLNNIKEVAKKEIEKVSGARKNIDLGLVGIVNVPKPTEEKHEKEDGKKEEKVVVAEKEEKVNEKKEDKQEKEQETKHEKGEKKENEEHHEKLEEEKEKKESVDEKEKNEKIEKNEATAEEVAENEKKGEKQEEGEIKGQKEEKKVEEEKKKEQGEEKKAEAKKDKETEKEEGKKAEGVEKKAEEEEKKAEEGEKKAEEKKAEEGEKKAKEGEKKAEEGEKKEEEGEKKVEEGKGKNAEEGEGKKAEEGEGKKTKEGEGKKAEEGEKKAEEGEKKVEEAEKKAEEGEKKVEKKDEPKENKVKEEKSKAEEIKPTDETVDERVHVPANHKDEPVDGMDKKLNAVLVKEENNLKTVLHKLDEETPAKADETEKVKEEKEEIKKMIKEIEDVKAKVEKMKEIETTESVGVRKEMNEKMDIDIIDVVTKSSVLDSKLKSKVMPVVPKIETSNEIAKVPKPEPIKVQQVPKHSATTVKTNVKELENEEKSLEHLRAFGNDAFPADQFPKREEHKKDAVPATAKDTKINDIDAQEEHDEEERAKEMVEKTIEEAKKEKEKELKEDAEKEKIEAEEAKAIKDEVKEHKEEKETVNEEAIKADIETPPSKPLPVPADAKNATLDDLISYINDEEDQVMNLIRGSRG